MSISVLQSAGNSSFVTASSTAKAFASNNTAKSLLVACGFNNDSSAATKATISDSQGNTWVLKHILKGTTQYAWVAYCLNCKAGANTVTYTTNNGSQSCSISCIAEISGVDSVASIPSSVTTSSSSWNSPSITMAQSATFLFGVIAWSTNGGLTQTIGAPFAFTGTPIANSNYSSGFYAINSSSHW